MWFGTKDGLNRYDGSRFTVFYHDPADSGSIAPGEISSITEDSFGNIWVVSGMLNRFDRMTERFTRFSHDPSDSSSLGGNNIVSLCESTVGGDTSLWLGLGDAGLDRLALTSRFDPKTVRFKHFVHDLSNPHSLSDSFVFDVHLDHRGVLWVATRFGLNAADLASGTGVLSFSHYGIDPQHADGLTDGASLSVESSDGSLWVGTYSGIYRLSPDRIGRFQLFRHHHTFPIPWHYAIRSITEDRQGRFWIAYLGGIATFDRKTSEYTWYSQKSAEGVPYIGVMTAYRDRGDHIWFGTAGYGLFQYDGRAKPFRYEPAKEFRDAIPLVLAADLRGSSSETSTGDAPRLGKPLQDALGLNTWAFPFVDRSGSIWVGTASGLYRFDSPSSRPKIYRHRASDPGSLRTDYINAVYQDPANRIWVLNGSTLSMLVEETDSFIHHTIDSAVTHGRVFSLVQDPGGAFWLSWDYSSGFLRFDPRTGAKTAFSHIPSDPSSLSNNLVPTLLLDPHHPDSVLWVGTGGGGLNRLDIQKGTFTRYTDRDGLPNNFVNGILGDERGILWISTNRGLSRFDPSAKGPAAFRNYEVTDGLQSNEFNQGCCYKSKSGEMLFWGVGGMNLFYPGEIIDNPLTPPVVLTDFRISNRSVGFGENNSPLRRPVGESEEIVISYRENIIGFEYAALDYRNPRKIQYAYKLENFQDSWVEAGNAQTATFTNLDPGTYTFRVKGSNSDGVWNERGASIRLVVTPPPWRTWWAYTLYAIAGIGLLYIARRYEFSRMRLKNDLKLKHVETESLRELDEMKSRFFANISHEFRTPLTLILGPVEQLLEGNREEKERDRLSLIRANASRLLRLINQLLDLSRLEARKVKLKARRANLVPFLRGIVMSFTSLAERKGIELRIQSAVDQIDLYFDRDALEKVFINLVSNAIKFTGSGGIINVDIASGADRFVQITVSDTGIGIPTEEIGRIFDRFHRSEKATPREFEGTGIGLALVQELVLLHRGTVSVKSVEGQGSSFIVRLPAGTAHLSPEEIADSASVAESVIPPIQELVEPEVASPEAGSVGSPRAPESEADEMIVLLIEDSSDVRAYIREQIDSVYSVVEAVDGVEGLEKAFAVVPDLVVSDLMMPKMDGYEVCKRLKSDERTSHIPVILLTAKAGDEDKLKGLETGADDYLVKPFNSRELVVRIRNLIDLRRTLRLRFSEMIMVKPKDIAGSSVDQLFLEKALAVVESEMGDEHFSVHKFSEELHMSHMQLHRKLKAITNQSAGQFIKNARLQRAADLLRNNSGNVSEIAYRVGFSSPAYFTKCFREQFGILPSDYPSARETPPGS
jgi:signal transduction histidine kinase/DNA-binding response OmpR family regulator/ligand-binding sensor domain-containing protein